MQQQFELVRSQMNSILENYDKMSEDCSNKEQVIQGVLRNLGNYKVDLKKWNYLFQLTKVIEKLLIYQPRWLTVYDKY